LKKALKEREKQKTGSWERQKSEGEEAIRKGESAKHRKVRRARRGTKVGRKGRPSSFEERAKWTIRLNTTRAIRCLKEHGARVK